MLPLDPPHASAARGTPSFPLKYQRSPPLTNIVILMDATLQACETGHEWTNKTCTPAYGTWCPWVPKGKCGFYCPKGCKGGCTSYSPSHYCMNSEENCENDCPSRFLQNTFSDRTR